VFTPVFQVLFLTMALLYHVLGDIGIAIVVTTIVLRIVLVPVFPPPDRLAAADAAAPAGAEGDQREVQGATTARSARDAQAVPRARGVSPTAGCLPGLLQLLLLLPMYSVFSQGLVAPDISSMLQILGQPVLDIACQERRRPAQAVHRPDDPLAGNLPAKSAEILFRIPGVPAFPHERQLRHQPAGRRLRVAPDRQTRMMATGDRSDPTVRSMQRMFLILPLFSILYGQILPAGLFLYWIVTTVFSIVQQYLIAGWGGLFPLFGWNPSFARDHKAQVRGRRTCPRASQGR
jgi:YidC/Oxa1 family membrane protein insertase